MDSSDAVLERVNRHYERSHFVGGMGESDPGVWFAALPSSTRDALEFAELVQESIELVKTERHGVPFGLYTTGIVDPPPIPLPELGLDTLQVSLFAGSPKDYGEATGRIDDAPADFGRACALIADAAEQGVAVEVGVLRKYASSGTQVALSLGARHVHVFDD